MFYLPQFVKDPIRVTKLSPRKASWMVSRLLSCENQRSRMRDLLSRGESKKSWTMIWLTGILPRPALNPYMLANNLGFVEHN